VWELETGEVHHTLASHSSLVNAVAVTPNGLLAITGSNDRTARVWDLECEAELCTFEGHTDVVVGVGVCSNGRYAVSASVDHAVKLWKVDNGELVASFVGDTELTSCALSEADTIVAGEYSGRIHILKLIAHNK
jgi:WD40 repeat protein